MKFGAAVLLALAAWAISSRAMGQDVADVAKGQNVFRRTCGMCHSADRGTNRIGPSLFGVVGRRSATVDGFVYSSAMKKRAVTWDEQTLDKYLEDPRAFAPGTKMTFAGLRKPEERRQVIAYLKTLH